MSPDPRPATGYSARKYKKVGLIFLALAIKQCYHGGHKKQISSLNRLEVTDKCNQCWIMIHP
ncbi:MAG: hypothetical protein HY454_03820 [Parcubacteria group bacterium]|nr:hypothetical protein [Parcubacteria group bacterium]